MPRNLARRWRWWASVALSAFAAASARPLDAAEPNVTAVTPRGLQVGAATRIVVDGADLGPAPRLLLPFPAKATLEPKSTATKAEFSVELGPDVPPGIWQLRVVNDDGVSLPVLVGVDRLPQRPLADGAKALPIALTGATSGAAVSEVKFAGKAGQNLLVEVEAQRLGSKLRPVVRVARAATGVQVGWAWPTPARSGDVRLALALPADDEYVVAVHDLEYAGAAPGHFRLKLGTWAYVDQTFPPVVGPQPPASVALLGNLPSPASLPKATDAPVDWPAKGEWSGLRPYVRRSPHAEVVADPSQTAKGQTLPAAPVGASGKLAPGAEDRFRVPATPGAKLKFEVFAERLGSAMDAAIVVRNDAGAPLARGEDSPGTLDPTLEYVVPAKTDAVLVGVSDGLGRGGVYRLRVTAGSDGEDVRLVALAPRLATPAGGHAVVPILADRRGYAGPIDLSAVGLPKGVSAEPATIPADADGALVVVRGSASEAAVAKWVGKTALGERTAMVKGHPLEVTQPWLASEFAVASASSKIPFRVDWKDLPKDAALVPSKKLTLPLKLERPTDASVVRLSLLTSQNPPLVNNNPDPNQTVRVEKAVELDAKKTDGELVVLVPATLVAPGYDVAVLAELLTADKKSVQSFSYTPVRRLELRSPVTLVAEGPATLEATLDPKKEVVVAIAGTIGRREGLTGDVTVALAGLPAGAKADSPVVKGDATAFSLKIALPPTFAPGTFSDLKLSASAVADPKTPNVRVRSRAVDLKLVVRAAK